MCVLFYTHLYIYSANMILIMHKYRNIYLSGCKLIYVSPHNIYIYINIHLFRYEFH